MYTYSIAVRHLRARSITWVAISLIVVVVLLYLLIISVLEGFKEHYMDKLQSVLAHVTITVGQTADGIRRPESWAVEIGKVDAGIRGVTIGLEIPAMAQFDNARTVGTLRGVDLPRELEVGRLKELIHPHDVKEFGQHDQGGKMLPGCIVGGAWRKSYGLSVGGRVTFVFTDEGENARSVAFAIIGFFEGKNPYLEQGAYVDRKFLADKIQVNGKAKTLAVWLADPDRRDLYALRDQLRGKMRELIRRDTDGHTERLVEVDTWKEKDNKFYQAVTRENLMMRFIMGVFLALVALVIFLIFGRLVAEKVRDIGALRAMGATPAGIRNCFLMQGFLIGIAGLAMGLVCSYFFIHYVNPISNAFGIDPFPGDSFGVEKIPTHTLPGDVLLICALTLFSSVAGAFFPAWRASQLNPVECLRHE